jgi:Zn finger protein HypA/HybF involved in hydrogenase expression
MKHKISDIDKFKQIVRESRSISQVAEKLGYKRRPNGKLSGGIFRFVKSKIKENDLDTSHMKGQIWAKGLNRFNDSAIDKMARKIEKDPFKQTYVNNATLIKRLILDGDCEYKCNGCGIHKWNDKPLRLHLDHKNGDNSDNCKENLRLLCPNCHSQTPTFSRGKNIKKEVKIMWWEKLCK